MSDVKKGFIAGAVFGAIDVVPMIFMDPANPGEAIAGAFINRFAIGFLIPNSTLPLPRWAKGLLVGLVPSLPDAIITGVYVPILGLGIAGGIVIGIASNGGETK